MKYDFDRLTLRRGTDCVKWDEAPSANVLPLWVADMDFETAPCVQEAIVQRARHGIYGYALVPASFFERIIWWNRHRHGWDIHRDHILYTSGVVPAVSAIIKALCRPGDGVLTFTPAYNCFFSSIRNNGTRLVNFPLTWSPADERYTIDFEALARVLRTERPSLFLLCNPHNPSGRVWTHEELTAVARLCAAEGITVLSDEIHCEFVHPSLGRRYVPFAPVAEAEGCRWVVANAPNKAFNIAGLQTAYIVAPDAEVRQRIDRALNVNEVCDINCFSFVALQAAYTEEGEQWLDQLVAYIFEGYETFRRDLKAAVPGLPVAHLEGTYLAWLDVSGLCADARELAGRLLTEQDLWVNPGNMYGQDGFLRVNLATQHQRLSEATRRLAAGLTSAPAL